MTSSSPGEPVIIESRLRPRPYQRDLFDAFFVQGYKRILRVAHRRAGKDYEAFNMLHMAALQRPGLYFYLLPTNGQANSVIWQGRGKDGTAFLDYIPKRLIEKKSEVTKRIHLINGSIICVTGSNNYEVLIGSNPLGIVLSETQSSDPQCLDYMRPVLAENGGWLLCNGTCRGRHNILYDLFSTNENNPDWFVTVKSARDTKDWDGNPIITKKDIDAEIQAGMPQSLVDQEFYCSWDGFVEGAYFTAEMLKMSHDERIHEFEAHPEYPVYTAWDLGWRDAMAVGLYQIWPDNSIRIIDYIEAHQKSLPEIVDILKGKQRIHRFKRFAMHFVPHDVQVHELGTGRTRLAQLRQAGVTNLKIAPGLNHIEKIHSIRALMNRIHMKKSTTKKLQMAMSEYHAETNRYGEETKPAHDWSSHGMDQLAYFATSYLDQFDKDVYNRVRTYAKRAI